MARKKSLFRVLLVLALLFLAIGGYLGSIYYNNFVAINIDTGGKETYLYIPKNASTDEVVKLLSELQVFKDSASFAWLAEQKNYRGKNIVPGKYQIEDQQSNNELINHLRAGNGRLDAAITFNQVRDLQQLSAAISKEIELDSTEVYSWLTNKDSIAQFGLNENTIIALFIPNTYYVDWDVSAPQLMRRFFKEYKAFWNEERRALLKKINLSREEVMTMASIVYWETKIPKDMKTIAGVYMNRIRIGIPLQADPTLIFAAGDYSIRRVLDVHKEIDSPYNTYKYRGLPPGPIIIPPIICIDAVLNYEKHNYLYFVAKEDLSGESYFSSNYSQHLVYARRYQNALNKRKVYR